MMSWATPPATPALSTNIRATTVAGGPISVVTRMLSAMYGGAESCASKAVRNPTTSKPSVLPARKKLARTTER